MNIGNFSLNLVIIGTIIVLFSPLFEDWVGVLGVIIGFIGICGSIYYAFTHEPLEENHPQDEGGTE